MDISELRREYTSAGLKREDLNAHPADQFNDWFKQAQDAKILEPNAMTLATAGKDGQPTTRTVLLKYFDLEGFVFFTNYESAKARQIGENPKVSLLFPWLGLERQAIVNGRAEKVSTAESARYFMSRPRGSQLGAWVSTQSGVIRSRAILEMKMGEMLRKFKNREIPLPSFWGGYRVVPHTVEFWQGRENRLHDRFLYTRDGGEWRIERLEP